MNSTKKYDLEDRLIEFAIRIMGFVEELPKSRAGNHIASQLIRCGTSPALNYGEVQSSESYLEFVIRHSIFVVCYLWFINSCLITAYSDWILRGRYNG
jgi:hypothetical protein